MELGTNLLVMNRDVLKKARQKADESFDASRKNSAAHHKKRHETISMPVIAAALSTADAQLMFDEPTYAKSGKRDGEMISVKVKGEVFTFHWKYESSMGVPELRCYLPVSSGEWSGKKLQNSVGALYGRKDLPTVTLQLRGNGVAVYVDEMRADWLDGTYGQQVFECAQVVITRARMNAARAMDGMGASSKSAGKRSKLDVLLGGVTKIDANGGPPLGTHMVGAASWRGMPVVATSDADGASPIHVMVERTVGGEKVWWPLPVPSDKDFPHRGASFMLEGSKVRLIGGVDGDDTTLPVRWEADLDKMRADGSVEWTKRQLKEAVAWAAVGEDARDVFVIGGVAGFHASREGKSDVLKPQLKRGFILGGYPDWRERSAPPTLTVGAKTAFAQGVLVVGPGAACDGELCAHVKDKNMWLSLPPLPEKLGQGAVSITASGGVLYTGGFTASGKASKSIWYLEPESGWKKLGENDAIAGDAVVLERDGRLVSILVSKNGSAMVHLE